MEGDLGLCMLNNREQFLLFLKPSPMLLMLSSELITMLMSEFGVRLSEILAITVEVCVIFTNSLIDATIQDRGKRERSDVVTFCLLCLCSEKEKETQN